MSDGVAVKERARNIMPQSTPPVQPMSSNTGAPASAGKYAHQAAKLSHLPQDGKGTNDEARAVEAKWVTPQDPIIVTAGGGRLPAVPLVEAYKLDQLKEELDGDMSLAGKDVTGNQYGEKSQESHPPVADVNGNPLDHERKVLSHRSRRGSLRNTMPPSHTHPLFPPLPLYGPPSLLRDIQCIIFRCTAAILSLAFLGAIVLGSALSSLPLMFRHIWIRLKLQDPDERRPFYEEEKRRASVRKEREQAWAKKKATMHSTRIGQDEEANVGENDGFIPTEGGPDPLVCDVAYYARRVGLDVEEFKVQTEDGFIIDLWHVYDPRNFTPLSESERAARGPSIFTNASSSRAPQTFNDNNNNNNKTEKTKYPVLMIHGLLQSAGAYCTNDDASLAFYLCKSGYDIWLGNNRCGFSPRHTLLSPSDPRMWAWNIRQMGVLDLPALISRVLSETGFPKLGLVAHSQGTTQTFVALAKDQRPDLGDKISVFCALAPAAYAGPLIGKLYFRFMRVISPMAFRIVFGIHAFIPVMMTAHALIPGKLYGALGYRVFSYLFDWSDERWDRGLRDRAFLFSPVYVSAESMRWWLGRECFARHKCILQTREERREEEAEDSVGEENASPSPQTSPESSPEISAGPDDDGPRPQKRKGATAWYDSRAPPFALWVTGADELVDGRRLLRRFASGREPHVRVVHGRILEGYEHLDVLWAVDMVERVGKEVRDVLWRTCGEGERGACRVPDGCEGVRVWDGIGVGKGSGSGSRSGSGSGSRSGNGSGSGSGSE